jgi:RNA polymerase sigma-70 factor (ECF subfamily)
MEGEKPMNEAALPVRGQTRADAEDLDVEALYRLHAPFVAGFVRRLGIGTGEVDDVVQEVFLIVHRKGGYRPGPATPRSWLGAIALRAASNARRARGRRREAPDAELVATSGSEASPARTLEDRQALGRVERALDTLDLEHRAVFVLFELEGESCAVIAEALGVPTGTVYSRLHNARKRFLAAHAALSAGEPSHD